MRRTIVILIAGTLLAGEAPKRPALEVPAHLAGLAKLRSKTTTANFQATPLDDVIAFVAQLVEVNIVVHPEVYVKKPAEQRKITLNLSKITGEALLKIIARLNDLDIIYDDDIFLLVPKGYEFVEPLTRAYDVGFLGGIRVSSHLTPTDELIRQIAETGGIISTEHYEAHLSDDFGVERFTKRMDAGALYCQCLAAIASGMIQEYGDGRGKAGWVPGTDVIVVVAMPDVQLRFSQFLLALADAARTRVKTSTAGAEAKEK